MAMSKEEDARLYIKSLDFINGLRKFTSRSLSKHLDVSLYHTKVFTDRMLEHSVVRRSGVSWEVNRITKPVQQCQVKQRPKADLLPTLTGPVSTFEPIEESVFHSLVGHALAGAMANHDNSERSFSQIASYAVDAAMAVCDKLESLDR